MKKENPLLTVLRILGAGIGTFVFVFFIVFAALKIGGVPTDRIGREVQCNEYGYGKIVYERKHNVIVVSGTYYSYGPEEELGGTRNNGMFAVYKRECSPEEPKDIAKAFYCGAVNDEDELCSGE